MHAALKPAPERLRTAVAMEFTAIGDTYKMHRSSLRDPVSGPQDDPSLTLADAPIRFCVDTLESGARALIGFERKLD